MLDFGFNLNPKPKNSQRLVLSGDSTDFVKGNLLLFTGKVVVWREEQHTVTFFPLTHGNAGTVPVSSACFRFFIFVMTTGTERGTQIIFVLCQPFNDDSSHTGIDTEVGAGTLGIAFGEASHQFEIFV